MKKIFIFLFCLLVSSFSISMPRIEFKNLLLKTEINPKLIYFAEIEASKMFLPTSIYIPGKVFIEAKDVEDGKVVYSVITNFAKPDIGGYTAFYDEVTAVYDLSKSRIRFADGRIVDNSGEVLIFSKVSPSKLLLIPDWTYDRVMAFDYFTGDLVDTAFVHSNYPNLQSPKQALQKSKNRVYVSDQVSDIVLEYDTNGVFIRAFAPAGGVNNTILDNIRGMCFRPNGNLLVCNAGSGASANTIQQFDTGGVFLNTFMSASVNSPFSLLYRQGDILLGNSSGTPKIFKYDFNGTLIGAFTNTTLNFVQQILKNTNGNIIACDFSGTGSGLKVFDSTGTLLNTLSGVTGVRGVFRLSSGNYLTTNGTGLFEIDDTTGVVVRQIYTASSLQYIDVFDKTLTGVNVINSVPLEYKLYNNYPNPFNPITKISFSIPKNQIVTIQVFDLTGKEISLLVNQIYSAGLHSVEFNASGLSSGIYFYKMTCHGQEDFSVTKKMVLIK